MNRAIGGAADHAADRYTALRNAPAHGSAPLPLTAVTP
jgi:hypothetical protein